MATKRTLIVLHHDEGYGDGLLLHLNSALHGKDMRAEAIVGDAARLSRLEEAASHLVTAHFHNDPVAISKGIVEVRKALYMQDTAADGEGEADG